MHEITQKHDHTKQPNVTICETGEKRSDTRTDYTTSDNG